MCGRLNVSDHPGIRQLMDELGVPIYPTPNPDLRPTQQLLALTRDHDRVEGQTMQWGMKPSWSKSLLINAKLETVHEKKTFAHAFQYRRCLIPCSGWYEWKDEGGARKQCYSFTHKKDGAFLMAGIWFPHDEHNQVVTLTTSANEFIQPIHHRMPVLINKEEISMWFDTEPNALRFVISPIDMELLSVAKTG